MTYRDLLKKMGSFTAEQLDCTVTVEISWDNECFPASLRIADSEHNSLDENHPVIFIDN